MSIAITGMRGLLLAAAATACGEATKGYAQTDVDAVKAAVAAYNQAVDSLDAAKMEALWLQDDTVLDIKSRSKSIGLGWEAVKKNPRAKLLPLCRVEGHAGGRAARANQGKCGPFDRHGGGLRQTEGRQDRSRPGVRNPSLRKTRRPMAARLAFRNNGFTMTVPTLETGDER